MGARRQKLSADTPPAYESHKTDHFMADLHKESYEKKILVTILIAIFISGCAYNPVTKKNCIVIQGQMYCP